MVNVQLFEAEIHILSYSLSFSVSLSSLIFTVNKSRYISLGTYKIIQFSIMLCQISSPLSEPTVFLSSSVPSRNENSSRCPLRAHPAAGGKRLFSCHLNRTQLFVQLDIQVHREGMLIHNRNLLIELVCKLFYYKLCHCLLIPANSTVRQVHLLPLQFPRSFCKALIHIFILKIDLVCERVGLLAVVTVITHPQLCSVLASFSLLF